MLVAVMDVWSYSDSEVDVRDDLVAAHRRVAQWIAAPGTWLSGAERVAVVEEARRADDCSLCAERKQALSPFSVDGEHDRGSELSAPIVDLIHRLRSDPGRLSKRWFDGLEAEGVPDTTYVEVLSLVSLSASLDFFARSLGIGLRPLCEPAPGEPTRLRPESAKLGVAWVPMVDPEAATGAEAELFGKGWWPNVGRALSLVPDAVRELLPLMAAQYIPLGDVAHAMRPVAGRAITRSQMEVVASRVSAINECFY